MMIRQPLLEAGLDAAGGVVQFVDAQIHADEAQLVLCLFLRDVPPAAGPP